MLLHLDYVIINELWNLSLKLSTLIMKNIADCDQELDITDKICPLTFVHTRLTIDSMRPGTILAVVLNEGEPLENVPRSLKELGLTILSLETTSAEH